MKMQMVQAALKKASKVGGAKRAVSMEELEKAHRRVRKALNGGGK